MDIIENVKEALAENNNKLSVEYINSVIACSDILYLNPTPTMRLCIITLPSGHEVLGKAQVLDPTNDVEAIGNQVAYTNAVSEVWMTLGNIAKCYV